MHKNADELRRGLSQSFFVRRGRAYEYVKAGDEFRQPTDLRIGERAKVLSLGLDGQKIPHVRYRVSIRRGHNLEFDGGSRIMALKPFLKLYSERVPTPTSSMMAKAAE